MKTNFFTALALSTIFTATAFAKPDAVVKTYVTTCERKATYLNLETNELQTRNRNWTVESQIYSSKDQTEETEIYKVTSDSFNGVESEDLSDRNGVSQNKFAINGKEMKLTVIDRYEYSTTDENGVETLEKVTSTSESLWKILEKTDKREVSMMISSKLDGVESKEKILKTKTFKSDSETLIETVTINPLEVINEGTQLLAYSKSCLVKKL